jgi:Inorganic Pyrophosphatase
VAKTLTYKGKPCSSDSVKKRVDYQGIGICIDRPKGSVMSGTDEKGEPWSRTYEYDYGFIPKTLGGDDDGLDVFVGPDPKAEDAFWAIQTKPDGSFDEYKCILPGQELVGTIVGGSKSFYAGQAVKLRSAAGKTLSITPNHPVLTLRGLIPAGSLKKGDYLLAYDGEGELATSGDHKQNPPTVVEQVFRSLVKLHPLGVSRKLVAPFDFHGDAQGFQGEVEVVRTYCDLWSEIVPQAAQRLLEGNFVRPLPAKTSLVGSRSFHERSYAEGPAGVGTTRAFRETPTMLGYGFGRPPSKTQRYRFGNSPDRDLALLKSASDCADVHIKTVGDAPRRLPLGVALDQIVDVEFVHYSGPVFDFESTTGLLVANRVIVSNCFLGFHNRDEAIGAYKKHIPKKFFSGLVTMKVDMMKAMLRVSPEGASGLKKAAMFVGFHDELTKIAEQRSPLGFEGKSKEVLLEGLDAAKHVVGGTKRKFIELAEASLRGSQ